MTSYYMTGERTSRHHIICHMRVDPDITSHRISRECLTPPPRLSASPAGGISPIKQTSRLPLSKRTTGVHKTLLQLVQMELIQKEHFILWLFSPKTLGNRHTFTLEN